jgi:hypothetical protein
MGAFIALQAGRSVYKWRKVIAMAVLAEAVIKQVTKDKNKKNSKSGDELMNDISATITRFSKNANDYIKQARDRLGK